jgi:hypothetical protein
MTLPLLGIFLFHPALAVTTFPAEFITSGPTVSDWQREGGNPNMDVTIPANTQAAVFVPGEPLHPIGPGDHQFRTKPS